MVDSMRANLMLIEDALISCSRVAIEYYAFGTTR